MRQARVLRVFTRGDEGGNGLGVVTDLEGLHDQSMQAIATGLNYSETIYLDPPDVRIFTPAVELQFAGHPLVGTGWVLADGVEGSAGITRCGIGEVEYSIADGNTWIEVPRAGPVSRYPDIEALATACSLPPAAAVNVVEVPQPYVVYEVTDVAQVISYVPSFEAMASEGVEIYLIAAHDDQVRARFFGPGLGVPEDPGTGSAAVALATLRMDQGQDQGGLVISQGDEVGVPCTIKLRWGDDRIGIGGTVREDAARTVD